MNISKNFNSDELPEELKGDIVPDINPEKLFDEKEYSTILIGKEGFSKKDTDNADYISVLVSKKSSREDKDAALKRLKENNAQTFIINAINNIKNTEQKASLIAACWETGLDFSGNFTFFIDLICHKEFIVAFEAFTVIQEMNVLIDIEILKSSIKKLNECSSPNSTVNDAIQYLESIVNS